MFLFLKANVANVQIPAIQQQAGDQFHSRAFTSLLKKHLCKLPIHICFIFTVYAPSRVFYPFSLLMFIRPSVTTQMRDDVQDWVGYCLGSGTHQWLTEGRSGTWRGPIWPIKGYWHFDQRSLCPSLMTFSNTQTENIVDLLRLHSGRFSRHRVALFSEVLELHKSKVYGFSYLGFCTTHIYKENRFFVSSSFPRC